MKRHTSKSSLVLTSAALPSVPGLEVSRSAGVEVVGFLGWMGSQTAPRESLEILNCHCDVSLFLSGLFGIGYPPEVQQFGP